MAFFKLRFPGRNSTGTGADALSNSPAESVEVIRKRARHRLMGSVVLVLGAVVGLPLLFDSQPRPVAIDTPIVIPDRNQTAPLAVPTKNGASKDRSVAISAAPIEAPANGPKGVVSNVAGLDPHEEVVNKDAKSEVKPEGKPEPKADAKTETKVETKPEVKAEKKVDAKADVKAEAKTEAKPETKTEPKADKKTDAKDAAKAKALLDGKDVAKPSDAVRSVVQVGAFADAAKAKEARAKLEHAGLKTYTQEVETKEGKRIRVRVGPFSSKEEADKAAEKIRKLNLSATVLKL
jgi:DedD protein